MVAADPEEMRSNDPVGFFHPSATNSRVSFRFPAEFGYITTAMTAQSSILGDGQHKNARVANTEAIDTRGQLFLTLLYA
jgi:hypothetical protein